MTFRSVLHRVLSLRLWQLFLPLVILYIISPALLGMTLGAEYVRSLIDVFALGVVVVLTPILYLRTAWRSRAITWIVLAFNAHVMLLIAWSNLFPESIMPISGAFAFIGTVTAICAIAELYVFLVTN
jgi:hypothetical protein